MENRRTHAARRALIAVLIVAAGCQAPASPRRPDRHIAAPLPQFSITQTSAKGAVRYVVCAGTSCPVPAPKAAPQTLSPSALAEKPMTLISGSAPAYATTIDIPFGFNETRPRRSDRLRLRAALLTTTPVAVTVVGRSDAAGTPTARLQVAQARAQAINALVLQAHPGTAVTVQHEIATVSTPTSSSRAYQRRATVHVTPSSHQP